jgi:hypothetical protein
MFYLFNCWLFIEIESKEGRKTAQFRLFVIKRNKVKGLLKKNDRIQRHGKIEITHTKTTKRRGYTNITKRREKKYP